MEISIPKTKALHIHKKIRVPETTDDDIASMGFKHICPSCERDFPNKRGLAIHQGRWCDGGKTVRSRKGSLADLTVQKQKRKDKESELPRVTIEGEHLDNVYSFEYLGSRIQCDGHERADVEYRMSIAQTTFNCLSHMWSDHRLSRRKKIRLYASSVCSAFTHGCEAWRLTEGVTKTVNGFNSRCLSIITGEDYRETAARPEFDLVATVKRRRLQFAGHIFRMDSDRLLRRTFIAYLKSWTTRPAGTLLHGLDSMPTDEVVTLAKNRRAWSRYVDSL